MRKAKVIAITCAALSLLFGAGHFMLPQTSATPKKADLAQPDLTLAAPVQTADLTGDEGRVPLVPLAVLPQAPPKPAMLPPVPIYLSALTDSSGQEPVKPLPLDEPAPGFACDYTLSATPAPGAMIALTLDAPCAGAERFTLYHSGMMFSAMTDAAGHASLLVPTLTKEAVFIAAFANGKIALAHAQVDSFDSYQRVAIQWQGGTGMHLHALEFGAGHAEQGHVWAGAQPDVAAAESPHGFLTRLGTTDLSEHALVAEIYTFPSDETERVGVISLYVEAEITAQNCEHDIGMQTLQTRPDGTLSAQDVTLKMPECAAIGDYLVLNNLLDDLTIAQN